MCIVFIISFILVYPFLTSFLSFFGILKLIPFSIYRFVKLLVILLYFTNNIK
nr:MAG TPA: hypothetical protein [Caudoviricetes sp.]